MTDINLLELQNGNDIRGVAVPGVHGEDVNLTSEAVSGIADAFMVWLCNRTQKNADEILLAIGTDSRLSGPRIREQMEKQLLGLGVNIMNVGMASTPAMFMSTVFPEYNCDAAIMITASHLPKNRNGFKFFTKNGSLEKTDIKEILSVAQGLCRTGTMDEKGISSDDPGHLVKRDLMKSYSEFLKDMIRKGVGDVLSNDESSPLSGIHIVVDAGNGAGGFYALEVLEPLGANIDGSLYLDPDGNFPNHQPNPENKEAMKAIKEAVLKSKADLGLIFDTDVDRSSAVDEKGNDISRNAIIALASALVSETHPGTTVVTDSVTSNGLTKFLTENLGLKHRRFKRGYKNIINESKRLNEEGTDSQLAIETSGHAAFKENSFLDDGAYLATKIVIKAAKLKARNKNVGELISDLKPPAEEEEFRLPLTGESYGSYGDKVLSDLKEWVPKQQDLALAEPNYEGVRIDFFGKYGDGWALLRKSLHDPLMPLNIESEEPGNMVEICRKLLEFLSGYEMLDITSLNNYCRKQFT